MDQECFRREKAETLGMRNTLRGRGGRHHESGMRYEGEGKDTSSQEYFKRETGG